jgi:uncharacterized protein (DUF983 family)
MAGTNPAMTFLGGEKVAMSDSQLMPPSPYIAGLTCHCPACGKGRLFENFLSVRPRCEACGLDYGFADAGDGPAIFVMLFSGFIVVGAALAVEILYQPPYWLHAVLWLPLILAVTLLPLRSMKGLLIALQFHHKAAEGRLERRSES